MYIGFFLKGYRGIYIVICLATYIRQISPVGLFRLFTLFIPTKHPRKFTHFPCGFPTKNRAWVSLAGNFARIFYIGWRDYRHCPTRRICISVNWRRLMVHCSSLLLRFRTSKKKYKLSKNIIQVNLYVYFLFCLVCLNFSVAVLMYFN